MHVRLETSGMEVAVAYFKVFSVQNIQYTDRYLNRVSAERYC
jgi:hypothetical protein